MLKVSKILSISSSKITSRFQGMTSFITVRSLIKTFNISFWVLTLIQHAVGLCFLKMLTLYALF